MKDASFNVPKTQWASRITRGWWVCDCCINKRSICAQRLAAIIRLDGIELCNRPTFEHVLQHKQGTTRPLWPSRFTSAAEYISKDQTPVESDDQ